MRARRRECRQHFRKYYLRGKLTGDSVLEHDVQLIENHIPISTTLSPAFDNILRGKIEQFSERIIVCKRRLVLCDLAELAVQAFDDICRICYLPDLGRVCEEGVQNIPVVFPRLDTGWIFLPHFSLNAIRFSNASSSVKDLG